MPNKIDTVFWSESTELHHNANHIETNGYIIIKQFFQEDELRNLNRAVDELEILSQSNLSDQDKIIFTKNNSDYSKKSTQKATVVDVRGQGRNYDGGMIDFFNPEFWLEENHSDTIRSIQRLKSGKIKELISKFDESLNPSTNNIYIHKSVTNPRGPHIDSLGNFVKIFCALTDHAQSGCGPLLISPGSQKKKKFHLALSYANKLRKLTNKNAHVDDTFTYNPNHMIPLLLSPGDIAICNLAMVHSAAPACSTGYRRTFVQTYSTENNQ